MSTDGQTALAPNAETGFLRSFLHRLSGDALPLPLEGNMSSFDGATGWLNSEPLTIEGLRGRVILVDFWTYTCINWIRTLPYLRAWDSKYRDHGLTIIGVHTPEFGFERNTDNVALATAGFEIEYPIAIDSSYDIWHAFDNHFWPAIYIADGQGRLRYHHFGEGEYAMIEMVVQQLLMAEGRSDFEPDLVSVDASGIPLAADWRTLQTPETYLGSTRLSGFASPERARLGEPHVYTSSESLRLNQWALTGEWTIWQHAATLNSAKGRIVFRFHARDVNLVMGPAEPAASAPFRVLLDGAPPRGDLGVDVDDEGRGVVTDQKLYQLIRQTGTVESRLFEIEFETAGVEAYSFTFG